jgi:glycosyltransferase involved in cell wall biosynthesis
MAAHMLMLEKIMSAAKEFDVIHFNIDYLHFPVSRLLKLPQLSTLHGRLDQPELAPLYRAFIDMPLVSISNDQRKPLSFANWIATVYHGLPPDLYAFHPEPGQYLAFLGRFSPEKRVDRAIEIAKRVGMELRIAAKLERSDQDYFDAVVKPLLNHPLVNYVGEIGEHEKATFLCGARALLFPIDWPEPFGLAMIEAMACGTPVIAFRRGSVPEVITDGESGYIVDNVADAALVVDRLGSLDRRRCRAAFEKRFTAQHMTRDYLNAYRRVANKASSWRVA